MAWKKIWRTNRNSLQHKIDGILNELHLSGVRSERNFYLLNFMLSDTAF